MDAAKALALALLAAVVAAGFAPLASAEVGNPTVPDVVYDAAAKKIVSGGVMSYTDTRDLQVINLETPTTVLWLCDSALNGWKSAVPDVVRKTVAFTSVQLANAGMWTVRAECTPDAAAIATFPVESHSYYDLFVSFPRRYTSGLSWSNTPQYMQIVVVDRANNNAPVAGADIVLWKGTPAERVVHTDGSGFWDTEEPLPGAGSFVIEAYKNTAGDPSYETFGRTGLTVMPRGALVTRIGEAPLADYVTSVSFKVQGASNEGALLAGNAQVANYTLMLLRPDGSKSWLTGAGTAKDGDLEVTPDGNVVVTTRWLKGSYGVTLRANAAGTVTDAAEWVQSWLVAADQASKHDLAVEVSPGRALAGEATEFTLKVMKEGEPFAADVYLLTHEEAMRVHDGSLSVAAIPAARVLPADSASEPGVWKHSTALDLAGGPYVVYAREPGTPRHDNAGSEPLVLVDPARVAFTPGRLAYGLQSSVPIEVRVSGLGGRALTGTLSIAMDVSNGDVGAGTTLNVVNGAASFVAEPISKGRILWDFTPTGSPLAPQRAAGALFVERPNITFTPKAIPLGTETALRIGVHDLAGSPLVGLAVELCGTPFAGCAPTSMTGANGIAVITGAPILEGKLALRINGIDVGETIEATSRVSSNIILGDPVLAKERVFAGEQFGVKVPVKNIGDAPGFVTLVLTIDGSQAAQQGVEVLPGETKTVLLTAAVNKVGTYTVSVAGGTAERAGLKVTVLDGGAPEGPSIPGFEGVLALGALAAVGLALRRRN